MLTEPSNNRDAEFDRIARHINEYLVMSNFRVISFEKIRRNIDPDYTDQRILELINRNRNKFRVVRRSNGTLGIRLV